MKDPAALLYIDTWLSSTAGMDADCRGWYLNLLLHQYDKKELPNDIETLAVLANVKFSEFERFKQVFEQVLKQKFKQNDKGNLENDKASEIIRKREMFKDKRSKSGIIGYIVKEAKKINNDNQYINYVKNNIDLNKIDTKDKQKLKQVLKQMFKLYINEDKDEDKDENINKDSVLFSDFWNLYHLKTKKAKTDKEPSEKYWKKLSDKEKQKAINSIEEYSKTNQPKYLKKARTYLTDKTFNDEFVEFKETKEKTLEEKSEDFKREMGIIGDIDIKR